MYKETNENYVILLPDTKIAKDENNRHYQVYLNWLSENNTPEPADAEEEILEVSALQGLLAIKEAGLVESFLAWKNSLDPVENFTELSFLEKAQIWKYDDPILNAALVSLGIEDQKNALFELAKTL